MLRVTMMTRTRALWWPRQLQHDSNPSLRLLFYNLVIRSPTIYKHPSLLSLITICSNAMNAECMSLHCQLSGLGRVIITVSMETFTCCLQSLQWMVTIIDNANVRCCTCQQRCIRYILSPVGSLLSAHETSHDTGPSRARLLARH